MHHVHLLVWSLPVRALLPAYIALSNHTFISEDKGINLTKMFNVYFSSCGLFCDYKIEVAKVTHQETL